MLKYVLLNKQLSTKVLYKYFGNARSYKVNITLYPTLKKYIAMLDSKD